jgi:hypothetical protein
MNRSNPETHQPRPSISLKLNRPTAMITSHIFLIIGLVFSVYWSNFNHAFHLDDTYGLLNNYFVRSLSYIPQYFSDPFSLTSYRSNADYRPILQISYAMNYLWSGYNSWSWHLVQLLLHCIVLVSVYFFSVDIAKLANPSFQIRLFWFAPFWIGVVGAVHPTASGVINYYWARSSLLVAAFLVPSFVFYLRSRSNNRAPLGALILFALALWTKVEAIAAVGAYVLIEAYIRRIQSSDPRVGLIANVIAVMTHLRKNYLWIFISVSVVYFVIRSAIMPEFAIEMRSDPAVTNLMYLYTQFTAWWYYIAKFFAPFGLIADYTTYPIFRSVFQPEVALSLGGIVIAMALLLRLWRNRPEIAIFPLLSFCIISPHSSFLPLSEMVNEHRPYLPMILFSALILHLFIERVQNVGRQAHLATKFVSATGLLVIVSALYGATIVRNKVFLTDESYNRDLVEKSPSARSYVNYGLVFLKRSEFASARNWFEMARNMAPNWFIPHVNLGIVEDRMGNADQAMAYYDRAVLLEAHTAISLKYRAMALEQRGNSDAAIADLRLALDRANDDCEIISRLVALLHSKGETDAVLAGHMKRCI